MDSENTTARYLQDLLVGDRVGCRQVLGEALQTVTPANVIYTDLFWPVMAAVEELYRNDRIDVITEHMATRINRTLVDQLQSKLPRGEPRGLTMLVTCADNEPEELGAQMCADLFESDGWTVKFVGSGVPNDEILGLVGALQPQILFIYGTLPSSAPNVRRLIDRLRLATDNFGPVVAFHEGWCLGKTNLGDRGQRHKGAAWRANLHSIERVQ